MNCSNKSSRLKQGDAYFVNKTRPDALVGENGLESRQSFEILYANKPRVSNSKTNPKRAIEENFRFLNPPTFLYISNRESSINLI